MEFTVDEQGRCHAHVHSVVYRTPGKMPDEDLQALKDRYSKITGDSHVINLKWIDPRQAGGIAAGVREALKYTVKPASIDNFSPDHLRQLLAMKKHRMFEAFGEFKKFVRGYTPGPDDLAALEMTPKGNAGGLCSTCGEVLFDVPLTDRELPDFLERIEFSISIKPQKTSNLRC